MLFITMTGMAYRRSFKPSKPTYTKCVEMALSAFLIALKYTASTPLRQEANDNFTLFLKSFAFVSIHQTRILTLSDQGPIMDLKERRVTS